jgi:hypothetical protein
VGRAKTRAEALLTSDPDHVPALPNRMATMSAAGKIEEARKAADRMLGFGELADPIYLSLAEFSIGL